MKLLAIYTVTIVCLPQMVLLSALNMNQACTEADDYSPDPSDCRKFFQCKNRILYSFTCEPGTAFDPVLKICNFKEQVAACNKVCTSSSDYIQDWNDCQYFYRCLNGKLVSFQCPEDTEFDASLKICICGDRNAPCYNSFSTQSSSYGTSTTSAKTTTSQITTTRSTPAQSTTTRSTTTQRTTSQSTTTRSTPAQSTNSQSTTTRSTTTQSTTTQSTTTRSTTTQSTTTQRCTAADDYSPDPTSCYKFFRCANGILFSYTCATGTAFDPILKICNFVNQVQCSITTTQKPQKVGEIKIHKDRCAQSDDCSPHPSDCRKFFRCVYGILYSFICADGTAFDPVMKICNHIGLLKSCNTTATYPYTTTKSKSCTNADNYTPHPSDCRKYYVCQDGFFITQYCPIGTIFHPEVRICYCKEIANDQCPISKGNMNSGICFKIMIISFFIYFLL